MREVEEERIDEESCFRGLEKVGNGISRARVEDKMAGTLGASKRKGGEEKNGGGDGGGGGDRGRDGGGGEGGGGGGEGDEGGGRGNQFLGRCFALEGTLSFPRGNANRTVTYTCSSRPFHTKRVEQ
ncbi:hypothetical protein HZH68_002450 [Vespula germanica]|uniref:Uncharacterized protein n=1 Tax=Vespula germanica TaxID=30212 RepID=A0A834NMB6_VESGE|nr:hypothetical protein HZH68_002450 [Vespula germanica]